MGSPASAGAIYNNGPNDNANFTTATPSSPLINGGHVTSDSFTLTANSTVNSVDFALQTYASELNIPTVDWAITSAPDAGTVFGSGVGALTNVFVGHPPSTSGISNFSSTFSTGSVVLAAGTYWLSLDNAVSPTGSVDTFWAESDGPSQAQHDSSSTGALEGLNPANFSGDGICEVPGSNGDCSQSFALNGSTSALVGVPEPAAWAMVLVGFSGLGATLRSRRRALSGQN